MTDVTKSADKD